VVEAVVPGVPAPVTSAPGEVGEHLRAAVRLAGLLTGDVVLAQDIGAEAVAKWLAAARRRTIGDSRAYVRRIVCNEVIGRHRRRQVERRQQVLVAREDVVRDASESVARDEALRGALRALPARQRAVLVLRYFEDLSEQETATVLDVPIGTVKSSAARGLEAMRVALAAEEDDNRA
jgi:RNA polymerase sigma factor (sigma-70 family)